MTNKRFRLESEKINNTYSIHIYKDEEVIFEISNWNSLSGMHRKECEDVVDLLNEQHEENEQLKTELLLKEDLIQQLKIALHTDDHKKHLEYREKYIQVCEELLEANQEIKQLKLELKKHQ